MTYPEAIQFLYSLRLFGTKFGLDNTFKLAALAGNPQENLRFIHVAGTNGKGSTCAMLESIYSVSSLRVGLFTSPHLVSFAERIQVNRQLIPEAEVARLVCDMQPLLKEFPTEEHPTFFEVVTVMALKYFAERKCDLVIWETGMGGRLDATNIVTPLATIITNVQLDHHQWLGDTLEKIAHEKAGIIKPGISLITAATEPQALQVILRATTKNQAPLIMITEKGAEAVRTQALRLPGAHQCLNAALAIATVGVLQKTIRVSDDAVETGLQTVSWPGRFQLIEKEGKKFLLDGAHNPAGAKALAHAFKELFPGVKPALILGILRDKDWKAVCQILAPLAAQIFLVPVNSDRTALPQELQSACGTVNPNAEIHLCESLNDALKAPAPFTLITGSLYLVGEALERLGIIGGISERNLNESLQTISISPKQRGK
jgi:dihydrofolate synthase / folylpolyglutamate synthase